MSYLAEPTSTSTYGVVQVGNFIDVLDGIISNPQDLSPGADVVFNSVEADDGIFVTVDAAELYDSGQRVVTSVTPSAGAGIAIQNLDSVGTQTSFLVTNTGVLSLTAGPGISLTTATGNITISSYGADLINVYGTSTNYTASLTDEYIGVSSPSAVIITLPAGVPGRVYTIKDEYGQGSGKITIQPQPGELVDKKTNYIISVPNQSVGLVFRAGSWWII